VANRWGVNQDNVILPAPCTNGGLPPHRAATMDPVWNREGPREDLHNVASTGYDKAGAGAVPEGWIFGDAVGTFDIEARLAETYYVCNTPDTTKLKEADIGWMTHFDPMHGCTQIPWDYRYAAAMGDPPAPYDPANPGNPPGGNFPAPAAYDFYSVILHELGHLLGLGHMTDAGANNVMIGQLNPGVRRVITVTEIACLKKLYCPPITGMEPDSIDHHLTYTVVDSVVSGASVLVADQFALDTVTVARLRKLLVPAVKYHSPRPVVPLFRPELHYDWWELDHPRNRQRRIVVSNQFVEDSRLRVVGPEFMLAPAFKARVGSPPDSFPVANHYLCYRVHGDTLGPVPVQLGDQFQVASVNVRRPDYFCAPCSKDSAGKNYPIVDEITHLMLYRVDPSWDTTSVRLRDQFGRHAVTIRQSGANQEYLVVPTLKTEVVAVDPPRPGAATLALRPPVPNPTGSGVALDLALPRAAAAELLVFDSQGRRVRTVLRGPLPAGTTRLVWDGRDDAGARVSNGVYFLRVTADGAEATRRVVLRR
jgi:hypothetical protein